jgi:hypothetical protein
MASYMPVTSLATSFTVQMGAKCLECYALVQDSDKWLHDQWHAKLETPVPRAQLHVVDTGESDEEMLRRLLREVMELSERME